MRNKEQIFQGMNPITFMIKAKSSPKFFCERVLGLDETNEGFSFQPFHKEWIDAFQKNKRTVIVAPRGHGKTTIMGKSLSMWLACLSPKKSFECLVVSYTQDQSKDIIRDIDYQMSNNELLKDLIPSRKGKEQRTSEVLEFTNGNKIKAITYSDRILGHHVNYVLLDEISIYKDHELFFRAIDPIYSFKEGNIVCIGTPTSEVDLLAKISKNIDANGVSEKGFKVLKYSAIKEDGTALWPKKWGLEKLKEKKKSMGTGSFNTQFLCKIENVEEEYFDVNKLLESADPNLGFTKRCFGIGFMGADFALSAGKTGDHSVFVVIDRHEDKAYLRYGIRLPKGTPIPSQEYKIREIYEKYKPVQVIIDETSCGAAFKGLINYGLPIIGQNFAPTNRALLLSNLKRIIDMGQLVIPMSEKDNECYTFVSRLIHELRSFRETKRGASMIPKIYSVATHDDTVFALALALKGFSEVGDCDGEIFYG